MLLLLLLLAVTVDSRMNLRSELQAVMDTSAHRANTSLSFAVAIGNVKNTKEGPEVIAVAAGKVDL